ncbi:capsule biosynthesis protein [Magnetospirillum fulvum]|uniref:capsule biosynthesis protein n=1 Tax=Magnetospirillum fulvum TaxID=1082 RepID=UPI001B8C350C|nr:capsule biosynthesis protein [Magnetospirillum fulvum]
MKEAKWFRPLRLANLERRLSRSLPDWTRLLSAADVEALHGPVTGRRVLIGTSVGMHLSINTLDSLLAVALVARGAQVEVLLCDGVLPACMACESNWFQGGVRFLESGPSELCRMCPTYAERMYRRLGIPVRRYSESLDDADRQEAEALSRQTPFAEIPRLVVDGIAIGEQAMAGTLRFFARSDLDDEPEGEAVLRRYVESAFLTARMARRLLAEGRYDVAVLHHGIYVPQGILAECARQSGTRVVTWNPAYRKRCFIFSHDDTYHHTLMNEPVEIWRHMPWSEGQDQGISDYLRSRWSGSRDWINFNAAPDQDFDAIATEFGLDRQRPIVALFTNVAWDAQLHYPANAFPTMLDWVKDTIAYFSTRPDLQLVIRIHPAEVTGALPSRQQLMPELAKAFPALAENIKVIPPANRASSHAIANQADAALIYGTKMGVELTSIGVPVIVAGEAWIRNKGVTLDACSREGYLTLLDSLPLGARMSADQVQQARRYAFHFFFRRMIPIEAVRPTKGWPPFVVDVRSLADLAPGVCRGLDVICRGILDGDAFIDPAERDFP